MAKEAIDAVRSAEQKAGEILRSAEQEARSILIKAGEAAKDDLENQRKKLLSEIDIELSNNQENSDGDFSAFSKQVELECRQTESNMLANKEIIIGKIIEKIKLG